MAKKKESGKRQNMGKCRKYSCKAPHITSGTGIC